MTVSFTVPGKVPSKSNYRRTRKGQSDPAWKRIRRYEEGVGMAAIVAGCKKYAGSGLAHVRLLLVNQDIDLDNAFKCPVDGLKNVAFKDDSKRYIRSLQVSWEDDDGPARVEYRIFWEAENVA